MKKLLAVIVIASSFLMSAQALHAEDDTPPHHNAERMLDRMAERLNLTEDQKNNISVIKKEEFAKIRALREENRTRIEGYLTEEQKQKMNSRKKSCNKSDRHYKH